MSKSKDGQARGQYTLEFKQDNCIVTLKILHYLVLV